MKAEQDATVAALKAAWGWPRVYNVGEVPPSPVVPYMDVSVASGTPINYRVGSRHSSQAFRAVVRFYAKFYDDVATAAQAADLALLDERIAEGYTPCRREVATPVIRDPDGGGLLMAVHTYTFTRYA